MPQRIQHRNTAGWRLPDNAIFVGAPSRWSNPYHALQGESSVPGRRGFVERKAPHYNVVLIDRRGTQLAAWGTWPLTDAGRLDATTFAVELFRRDLLAMFAGLDGNLKREYYLGNLPGHDLSCWCPLNQHCHADVLLELANTKEGEE